MLDYCICQDWRPVAGYESYYLVNSLGMVYSLRTKRMLGQRIDREGYVTVRLNKPGRKSSTQFVHRIIALAFIPNPDGKCCVNHLNGNRKDYRIENLEWATTKENMKHAYVTGLCKPKTKKVIDQCTGQVFKSAREAAAYVNLNFDTVRQYLNGGIKTNPTCLQYLPEAA